MRKAMAVLTAAGVVLWITGASAQAQTGSVRDGKDSAVSFRLASERPTRGFEAVEIGSDRTLYVANQAVFGAGDVASVESADVRGGVDMKLTVSADGLSRLQTEMRATGADHLAVMSSGKVLAAGSLKIESDRVSLSGLNSTQATRLTNVLSREGSIVPGASITLVPTAGALAPGGTVNVDVFINGVSDLRSYQVQLAITGGTSGAITVSNLQIDANRGDQVFANQQKFDAVDPVGGRLGGVMMAGGVNVANPAYAGTYTLQATSDASGTFNVKVEQAGRASLLWSSQNTPIEFSSPALSMSIGKPGSIRSRD